jgi:DNA-binding PadR family transcriptional regulator
MVLGTLASHGPMHGHQIRRVAEASNVGEWGGVSVGALYRELRNMDADGLLEAVRTEKVGRRPARTIYAITDDGQFELHVLRDRALRELTSGPDSLGVALAFAWNGIDPQEAADTMQLRRQQMAIAGEHLAAEVQRLQAKGHIGPIQAAVMRRGVMHIETEVRWHDEFAKILTELPPEAWKHTKPGLARGGSTAALESAGAESAAMEPAAVESSAAETVAAETDRDIT